MRIYKHKIVVTVLSEDKNPFDRGLDLSDIGYRMNEDDLIGNVKLEKTVAIPKNKIEKELKAIGNDGTFFDYVE